MKNILTIVVPLILMSDSLYGQLDVNFNGNGKLLYEDTYHVSVKNMIGESDEKILLTGEIGDSIVVYRINSNGSFDNTFDYDGKLYINLPYLWSMGTCLGVRSDNSVIVGGNFRPSLPSSVKAFILNTNTSGIINNDFGTSGYTTIEKDGFSGYYIKRVKILPDDKIIALTDYDLFRLEADGAQDNTFGTNGIFDFNISGAIFHDMTLQSDGKILIAGESGGNSVVLRLNPEGTFDNTFGTNGVKTVDVNNDPGDRASSVIQLENGNILVGGYYDNHIYLMQLNSANGDLVTSYGVEGVMSYSYPEAANSLCNAIAEDLTSNDVLVAGTALYGAKGYFALSRVSSSGVVEAYAAIDMSDASAEANSICIQPDRKIVIAGSAIHEAKYHMAVARFVPDFTTLIQSVESSETISMGVNIFPNPSSHYINLHSVYSLEQVKVLDMLGNEVLNQSLSGNTKLDVSSLPKGLYNFILTTDRGTGCKKVSVQ